MHCLREFYKTPSRKLASRSLVATLAFASLALGSGCGKDKSGTKSEATQIVGDWLPDPAYFRVEGSTLNFKSNGTTDSRAFAFETGVDVFYKLEGDKLSWADAIGEGEVMRGEMAVHLSGNMLVLEPLHSQGDHQGFVGTWTVPFPTSTWKDGVKTFFNFQRVSIFSRWHSCTDRNSFS